MKKIDEITTLLPGEHDLLQRIKAVVRGLLPTAMVLLYGSVARGSTHPDSDYDVLILTENPLTSIEEDEVFKALFRLELDTGIVISALFYAANEWNDPVAQVSPFHCEVERDAIML